MGPLCKMQKDKLLNFDIYIGFILNLIEGLNLLFNEYLIYRRYKNEIRKTP